MVIKVFVLDDVPHIQKEWGGKNSSIPELSKCARIFKDLWLSS
jgi:hypothetical protein